VSPLPKKKKTPEELAALRESLGISPDGPPPGAPGVMGAATTAPVEAPSVAPIPEVKVEVPMVPLAEPVAKVEPEVSRVSVTREVAEEKVKVEEVTELKPKPVRSLRRSERLPVDQPKKVVSQDGGKLPTRRHREGERIPLEKPAERVSVGSGSLPTRKHTDQELARMRLAPLPGVEPAAVHLARQTMGLFGLIAIYGVGVILMLVAGSGVVASKASSIDLPFDWLRDAVALPNFLMILFGIMAGGVAVLLLGAAWIYFKKQLSLVHAALMTIIAVLVLVFGTLYFFPGLHGA
jgi:hypothetical protein